MLKSKKGFTLIELMIVIAIIGILAAIAIPNFVAYRNKSFCSRAEADANSIASSIADYFSIPTNTSVSWANLGINVGANNAGVTLSADNPNLNITIQVKDATERCPATYQTAMTSTANPRGYWNGSNVYTKLMKLQ